LFVYLVGWLALSLWRRANAGDAAAATIDKAVYDELKCTQRRRCRRRDVYRFVSNLSARLAERDDLQQYNHVSLPCRGATVHFSNNSFCI
jgi:hypothetical protein